MLEEFLIEVYRVTPAKKVEFSCRREPKKTKQKAKLNFLSEFFFNPRKKGKFSFEKINSE